MKSFDTRAYSINDIFNWKKNKELELSPKFQRRSVWTENACSYLIDTIICGKPIPKIFIRQKINPSTHQTIREVVDGQQRLRTILSFLDDGFKINKKHNIEYGGKYYSQLDSDLQANILNYEISTDLLINMSDSEVLDIFGRLNSYAVTLNDQEKIHANHFGPFKILADNLGHKFFDFWVNNKIITQSKIVRMADVELVSDLLIAAIEGIKSKKQIKFYYSEYEDDFEYSVEELNERFVKTLSDIEETFKGELGSSEFHRVHLFYSLFTAFYHLRWGIKGIDRGKMKTWNYSKIKNQLIPVEEIFAAEDVSQLKKTRRQFIEDSRRATTDGPVRIRRTEFIIDLIL